MHGVALTLVFILIFLILIIGGIAKRISNSVGIQPNYVGVCIVFWGIGIVVNNSIGNLGLDVPALQNGITLLWLFFMPILLILVCKAIYGFIVWALKGWFI